MWRIRLADVFAVVVVEREDPTATVTMRDHSSEFRHGGLKLDRINFHADLTLTGRRHRTDLEGQRALRNEITQTGANKNAAGWSNG